MAKGNIPTISDEEVLRRYSQVRPLFNGKKVSSYNIFDMRTQRDWSDLCTSVDLSNKIDKYRTIGCYYNGIYPYVKYPTIAEILSQIPEEDLRIASYFEVTDPGTSSGIKHNDWDVVLTQNDNGCTKVEVSLYRIKPIIE